MDGAFGWRIGVTYYLIKQATTSGGLESATATEVAVASITINETVASSVVSGLNNGATYYFQVAAKNSTGTGAYSDEDSATPSAPSSLNFGLEKGIDLHIYPSPTSRWVQVSGLSTTKSYRYEVHDLRGQEVLSGTIYGASMLDLGSLSDGQYILIVERTGVKVRTRVLLLK